MPGSSSTTRMRWGRLPGGVMRLFRLRSSSGLGLGLVTGGQPEPDGGAAADAFALGAHAPAVLLNDVPADVQPQAHAGQLLGVLGAAEGLEDVVGHARWETDPLISHFYPYTFAACAPHPLRIRTTTVRLTRVTFFWIRRDVDGAAALAVLGGVAEHVHEHLLQAPRVRGDGGEAGRDLG